MMKSKNKIGAKKRAEKKRLISIQANISYM